MIYSSIWLPTLVCANHRYVIAVLAVYVDDSVDGKELKQIIAAAELLGVPVESAPTT